MKIKSFLMLCTILVIFPVFAQANSSWQDFCADVKWFFSVPTLDIKVSCPSIPSMNSADVALASVPVWSGYGLWRKGFNICHPIESTKNMFFVNPEARFSDLVRLGLDNKAYLFKRALKNSGKVAAAAYLTGFGYHLLSNSDKK